MNGHCRLVRVNTKLKIAFLCLQSPGSGSRPTDRVPVNTGTGTGYTTKNVYGGL